MNYLNATIDPTPAPELRPKIRIGGQMPLLQRLGEISKWNPDLAWQFSAQGRRERSKTQPKATQVHVRR